MQPPERRPRSVRPSSRRWVAGQLHARDLARAHAWAARAAAEQEALAGVVRRAGAVEARARDQEQETQGALAARSADVRVVAGHRERWDAERRRALEAREEEALSEAWRRRRRLRGRRSVGRRSRARGRSPRWHRWRRWHRMGVGEAARPSRDRLPSPRPSRPRRDRRRPTEARRWPRRSPRREGCRASPVVLDDPRLSLARDRVDAKDDAAAAREVDRVLRRRLARPARSLRVELPVRAACTCPPGTRPKRRPRSSGRVAGRRRPALRARLVRAPPRRRGARPRGPLRRGRRVRRSAWATRLRPTTRRSSRSPTRCRARGTAPARSRSGARFWPRTRAACAGSTSRSRSRRPCSTGSTARPPPARRRRSTARRASSSRRPSRPRSSTRPPFASAPRTRREGPPAAVHARGARPPGAGLARRLAAEARARGRRRRRSASIPRSEGRDGPHRQAACSAAIVRAQATPQGQERRRGGRVGHGHRALREGRRARHGALLRGARQRERAPRRRGARAVREGREAVPDAPAGRRRPVPRRPSSSRTRATTARALAMLASIPDAYPDGDMGGEALFRVALDELEKRDLDGGPHGARPRRFVAVARRGSRPGAPTYFRARDRRARRRPRRRQAALRLARRRARRSITTCCSRTRACAPSTTPSRAPTLEAAVAREPGGPARHAGPPRARVARVRSIRELARGRRGRRRAPRGQRRRALRRRRRSRGPLDDRVALRPRRRAGPRPLVRARPPRRVSRPLARRAAGRLAWEVAFPRAFDAVVTRESGASAASPRRSRGPSCARSPRSTPRPRAWPTRSA